MKTRSSWSVALFDALFPETKISVSPWATVFWKRDRERFKRSVNFCTTLCALAYVLHYFFVDRPQGKSPDSLWLTYRFGVAAWCMGIFFLYRNVSFERMLRFPFYLSTLAFCYLQGLTLIWHPGTPYQYGFIIAFVMAWSLHTSLFRTMLSFTSLVAIQWPSMLTANAPYPHMWSHTILFGVSLAFTRLSYKTEIDGFISDMELKVSQQKNIEQSIEFSNQLLAFLPKLVGLRLKSLMVEEKIPIAAATDLVLRPRTVPVACIYSDIRGFTKKSKKLEYISKFALQEIQAISNAIDESMGIPRKIGDLMFAYFDSSDLLENALRSSQCAIKIYKKNQEMNVGIDPINRIERKIILTCGIGIVGNLGTSSSSIEITAMGSSVNLAARIDELTKHDGLQPLLKDDLLICSGEFGNLIKSAVPDLNMSPLNISELGIAIRDFKDEGTLWLLEASLENEILLKEALQGNSQNDKIRSMVSKVISNVGAA